ncbi:hypothetical protein AB0H58_24750 [Nocardia neocaledoniensis]|uniref:hypothetical protein n=1 Tax=Nocardia neocaledoniensis TaxID=236511 RepID=UPI0033CAB7DA
MPESPFTRYDRTVHSPFCLAVGTLAAYVATEPDDHLALGWVTAPDPFGTRSMGCRSGLDGCGTLAA